MKKQPTQATLQTIRDNDINKWFNCHWIYLNKSQIKLMMKFLLKKMLETVRQTKISFRADKSLRLEFSFVLLHMREV